MRPCFQPIAFPVAREYADLRHGRKQVSIRLRAPAGGRPVRPSIGEWGSRGFDNGNKSHHHKEPQAMIFIGKSRAALAILLALAAIAIAMAMDVPGPMVDTMAAPRTNGPRTQPIG